MRTDLLVTMIGLNTLLRTPQHSTYMKNWTHQTCLHITMLELTGHTLVCNHTIQWKTYVRTDHSHIKFLSDQTGVTQLCHKTTLSMQNRDCLETEHDLNHTHNCYCCCNCATNWRTPDFAMLVVYLCVYCCSPSAANSHLVCQCITSYNINGDQLVYRPRYLHIYIYMIFNINIMKEHLKNVLCLYVPYYSATINSSSLRISDCTATHAVSSICY